MMSRSRDESNSESIIKKMFSLDYWFSKRIFANNLLYQRLPFTVQTRVEIKKMIVSPQVEAQSRNYSQGTYIKVINQFLKIKKSELNITTTLPCETVYLDLNKARNDLSHLIKAIDYRLAKQREANLVQEGYCYWLLIFLWISFIDSKSDEFFHSLKLIMDHSTHLESHVLNFFATLEYAQWASYHTNGQLSFRHIEQLLKQTKQLEAKQYCETNLSLNGLQLTEKIHLLRLNEMMIISSKPPEFYKLLKHAVGVIYRDNHYYFYDFNSEEMTFKKFTAENVGFIFSRELPNSFYKRFAIPLPINIFQAFPMDIDIVNLVQFVKIPKAETQRNIANYSQMLTSFHPWNCFCCRRKKPPTEQLSSVSLPNHANQ